MVVGSRYAKSLMGLAFERGQLEEVYADMCLMHQVCTSNDDFVNMLESPLIKTDKKQSIIREIFGGKIHDLTMSFMMLMADKKREGYLDDIANSFVDLYKQHKGIISVVITSATVLTSDTKEKMLSIIQKSVTGKVELTEKIDPSLIGGFKIKVGDKQIDASVLRRLNDLKKDFAKNPFVKEY